MSAKNMRSVAASLCLQLLLAMACAPARAQTAPANGGRLYRIAGKVVNGVTGEPVQHATVAVLSAADSHTVQAVESGMDGSFALEGLPAAKYQLTAAKRGFHTTFYNEHEEYNSAVVTGEGQETSGLTMRLLPGAVLHGVVAGEGGDPVENAKVMLFKRPRLHRSGVGAGPYAEAAQVDTATTDDTGAYEFDDLTDGEYVIAVVAEPWYALHRAGNPARSRSAANESANAALDVAYPITFFDSTTEESSATHIVLAAGRSEEANINLHPVPALHLTVELPHKENGATSLPDLRQTIFGTQVTATSNGFQDAARTGTVEFSGVAPGHYELTQGDPPRVAELDATVNLQVDPTLGSPTVTISGSLRTPNDGPLQEDATVTLNPHDGTGHLAPIPGASIRGSFSFPAVPPGVWEVWVDNSATSLPAASVTVGSRTHAGNLLKVKDRPLSITVTASQGGTRIEGFAKKAGKGHAGVMVVLVPRDLGALPTLARRDQSDSDGSFSLRDAVPGQYTVVAIENGWDLDWTQPEGMSRFLPQGVAVTVTAQSGQTIQLSAPVPVQAR